jgi:hypothetical protein
MLFPGSRLLPETMPPHWVVTGAAAITDAAAAAYLRISAHALKVFL